MGVADAPRRLTRTAALVLAAALARGAAASAQSTDPDLALDTVLQQSLARHPAIVSQRAMRDASFGDLVQARRPFDWQPQAFASSQHDALDAPGVVSGSTTTVTNTTRAGLALQKVFRSGVGITMDLALTRTAAVAPDLFENRSVAELDVDVPLLRGRRGGYNAAAELSLTRAYDAATLDLQHLMSSVVAAATGAYWDYLAATRRADVYRTSTARASRLVDETKALIAADERAPSDLDLIAANLTSKQATLVMVEQQVHEARVQLAKTMGLDAGALPLLLGAPSTTFPPVSASDAIADLQPPAAPRTDYEAALVRARASEALYFGAAAMLRPTVDIQVQSRYVGQQLRTGPAQFFATVFNPMGFSASVQIQYQPGGWNSADRGLAIRTAALLTHDREAAAALRRDTALDFARLAAAVTAGRRALGLAAAAIESSARAVDTEREKFALGVATIFDVLIAEDALVTAELAGIDANALHAKSIAGLQFVRGPLVRGDDRSATADLSRLLTIDLEERR